MHSDTKKTEIVIFHISQWLMFIHDKELGLYMLSSKEFNFPYFKSFFLPLFDLFLWAAGFANKHTIRSFNARFENMVYWNPREDCQVHLIKVNTI